MKRVLISGGSGFIGKRLAAELLQRGDHVTVLTRNVQKTRRAFPSSVRVAEWQPTKLGPWAEELEVVDAVVHLSGAPVAVKWNAERKKLIESSRVDSTRMLVEAIGKAKKKPSVFVCASAVGYYPVNEPEELDESAEPGKGFLSKVVAEWEAEAKKVAEHGVRDVEVRIGVVLGEGGGALEQMIKPFKVFMGGPIGKGTQYVPWVHRDDVVGIIVLALDNEAVKGPINAVSPNGLTNAELAKAIGLVMNRSAWLRTPAAVMELALGEGATIVLDSQRIFPKKAAELGYEFRFARPVPALENILGPG